MKHTNPYEVACPFTDSAILTQPHAGTIVSILECNSHKWFSFLGFVACLHVPAEDGEDDAGVSGDGEEGDGAEERELGRGWRWRGHL